MNCLETATTHCIPSTLAVLVAKRCALITRSFCSLGAFCCPLRSSLCFMAFKLSFLPSYFPACNHLRLGAKTNRTRNERLPFPPEPQHVILLPTCMESVFQHGKKESFRQACPL